MTAYSIQQACEESGIKYTKDIFDKIREGLKVAKKDSEYRVAFMGPCKLIAPLQDNDITKSCANAIDQLKYSTVLYEYIETISTFRNVIAPNSENLTVVEDKKVKMIYVSFEDKLNIKTIIKLAKLKAFL